MPDLLHRYAVFIGRFQPYHLAHQKTILRALKAGFDVIVAIGSANQPRSHKNPFNFEERKQMILSAHAGNEENLHFIAMPDFGNDARWRQYLVEQVSLLVNNVGQFSEIHLIGHDKDASTYYLKLFPEWPHMVVENIDDLSATPIRENYWKGQLPNLQEVPVSTLQFLQKFQMTKEFKELSRTFN